MNPEPADADPGWTRLVAAVDGADGMDAAAADAHLVTTLGDTPELLEEAREILAGGRRRDAFLEQPPTGAEAALSDASDTRFEGFRLEGVLGRGGMGTVYRAEQDAPRRTVALKVLSTLLADERARARFEYESQALAALRHPGIAQVYAAGVSSSATALGTSDVPWFAMEFVPEARTIVEHSDEQGLGRRARVALLIEVLNAVQHAHRKGILHRDLKPDNILIGRQGRPKIIDFGVARALTDESVLQTLETHASQIVGTLPYMSPERLSGGSAEHDAQGDVYSLGVVLYELLTGKLPIEVSSKDLIGSIRRITEREPARPSRHDPSIPADLDAIVLRALAKRPGERYPTANALADDLKRFQTHRPVEARPPTLWRTLALFSRRHRALVAASAITIAVGIMATIISVSWAVQSTESERRAQAEREEAVEERARAEDLFETLLERSLESTLTMAPQVHAMQGGAAKAKKMMDEVLADIEVLEQLSKNDPRVQVLLAETWMRVGDTQGNRNFANLGKPDEALASYSRALASASSVLSVDASHVAARLARARAQIRMGEVLREIGLRHRVRGDESKSEVPRRRALLDEALADARKLAKHPDVGRQAARLEVQALANLGRIEIEIKDFEAGLAHADAIRDLHAEGRLPKDDVGLLLRAWCLFYAKRFREAAGVWDEVVALREALHARKPPTFHDELRLVTALGGRAEAWLGAKQYGAAADGFAEAIRILVRLYENDPKDRNLRTQLLVQRMQLVEARWKEAAAAKDAVARRRALVALVSAGTRAIAFMGPADQDSPFAARGRSRFASRIKAARAEIARIDGDD